MLNAVQQPDEMIWSYAVVCTEFNLTVLYEFVTKTIARDVELSGENWAQNTISSYTTGI